MEPLAGKGHPGPQPSSARRARLLGKRSRSGAGGRPGQEELDSGEGGFSVGWILGNDRRFLLILVDNYNQTTNDPTTETQSAQRTHGDF